MINITHELSGKKVEKQVREASFLLANKAGGFAWFSQGEARSKYRVFFTENNKVFRVIEHLGGINEPESIVNKFFQVDKVKSDKKETFFMPDFLNSVTLESDTESRLVLDFKEAYKNDSAEYDIKNENNYLVVKISYEGSEYYLVGKFSEGFLIERYFLDRDYEYDRNRNSFPSSRRVVHACRTNSKKIVISFSQSKNEAIEEADYVFSRVEELKTRKRKRVLNLVKNIEFDENVSMAYNACRISLDNLALKDGIFAGYPWFFQFWARDELISLKTMSKIDKKLAYKIEERWLSKLDKSSIYSKLNLDSSLEGRSVDAVGWLAKRIEDFPEAKKNLNLHYFFMNLDEKMMRSGKQETWMDSLSREGFNIEIQAMKLYSLKLAYSLTRDLRYRATEIMLKKEVRSKFWNGSILADAVERKEVRPNIFIAYYFYPELLSKEEWEKCFDSTMKSLWTGWGGVSTLDKGSGEYHENYSGENGSSYHNGDSWFWINNLAALCMYRLNKDHFLEYITRIVSASTEEILYLGAMANHCELSSSSHLHSCGCVSQAFSAAMYLEMIDTLMSEK